MAEVLFSMLVMGFQSPPVIGTYGSFAVFVAVTVAVMCCMDVLECFLHALRLHWVEFQNKFYYADGIAFEPFDYNKMED